MWAVHTAHHPLTRRRVARRDGQVIRRSETVSQQQAYRRSAVARVVSTLSFVSVPIVAGEPRHELLLVPHGHLGEELFSFAATQHSRSSAVVFDDNVAVLPAVPRETVGVTHRAAQMHGSFEYVARRKRTAEPCTGSMRGVAVACDRHHATLDRHRVSRHSGWAASAECSLARVTVMAAGVA